MRISFVVTGLFAGGAETMLLRLLQYMDRSGFAPHVISLTGKGEIGPRIEALGIPVHALGMRPGKLNVVKFLHLIRLLRNSKPDIVQTWMYHADLLGGLAARLAGIRTIVWGIRHGNPSFGKNKRLTLLVTRVCALMSGWLPRRILTCSERARIAHVAAGYRADRIALIPNGFDLGRFIPDTAAHDSVRADLGLPAETPLVGVIARDDPQKNHLGFIEAAARVSEVLPHVHFVLAGAGIDQGHGRLVQAIQLAGLRDRVHLLGRREDIPRLMASLDVLASPSHGEAFPNVVGEAMACAVPCVVTDVGDSAEIVGDTGRVVPPSDVQSLATNLIELLQLPVESRRAMGARARERVRERYEIADMVRRHQEFYVQLLGETV